MSNTAITVAMAVQGNAAFTTQGGLWKMNFEEGITHFLEKQVSLESHFRNVGAITAGQIGSTSITVSGDLDTFDPLNDHVLSNGTISFGSIRLQTDDAGKQFPFMDRAVNRLNTIEVAGVIREISKHIANRTVKRHNNSILTAINSGVLSGASGNTLTGTLGANMFYDLANKIEDNEVDVHDGEYIMLCSNNVLQKLNAIELWQNTDVNGGARMPYVMGSVGGEQHGFGITWVNCGALMNQFFGNKNTLLFARKEDIQYATEKGAEGLRVYIQNKGSQISSEATEVVAKDSFGAGIASDGIIANERALKNRNIYKITFS
jgi:hypothetical protein